MLSFGFHGFGRSRDSILLTVRSFGALMNCSAETEEDHGRLWMELP
jgi:hypothetical protein